MIPSLKQSSLASSVEHRAKKMIHGYTLMIVPQILTDLMNPPRTMSPEDSYQNEVKKILDVLKLNKTAEELPEGDFSFLVNDREMTTDHWTAVQELDLVQYFKTFQGESFMFSSDPELSTFNCHPLVQKYGHSGMSFAFMCRQMQCIAKGWQEYVKAYFSYYNDVKKSLSKLISSGHIDPSLFESINL